MSHDQLIKYSDRLYGQIELASNEVRLLRTKEFDRLHHITIVNNPPWLTLSSVCASKFEHSIGVAHLAKIALKNKVLKELEKNLFFAALTHDVGTPPFSHTGERFLKSQFGINHEEFVEEILSDSELGKEIENQGGSIETIVKLINGQLAPWSDIINGSIDLDNLDNSPRCAISMGLANKILYSPAKMAQQFSIKNGKLTNNFTKAQTTGWRKSRQILYDFIYSPTYLSPIAMLGRALDFASNEGKLTKRFFRLTNLEAYNYLLESNPRSQKILALCNKWNFYEHAYSFSGQLNENKGITSSQLSDNISQLIKTEPENVAVSIGKDRRDISKTSWIVQVYVHPQILQNASQIHEYMKNTLK